MTRKRTDCDRPIYYTADTRMVDRLNDKLDFAVDLDFDDILTNPILDIGARFWEEDRYEAFRVCYRSMRLIDDLVDNRKAGNEPISRGEASQYARMIDDWLAAVCRGDRDEPYVADLLDVLDRFAIPVWPWERLARAMVFDLTHDGFASFRVFLRYTEGAAIAPASIFTHLCGVSKNGDRYAPPRYDIRDAARLLALFSYLVHIMRDFEKDQRASLNYFSLKALRFFGLEVDELREMAQSGLPDRRLRELFGLYYRIAGRYQQAARRRLDQLAPELTDRYRLSLEIIYELYSQIYELIDPAGGSFTAAEHQPSADAVRDRIDRTVANFRPSGG